MRLGGGGGRWDGLLDLSFKVRTGDSLKHGGQFWRNSRPRCIETTNRVIHGKIQKKFKSISHLTTWFQSFIICLKCQQWRNNCFKIDSKLTRCFWSDCFTRVHVFLHLKGVSECFQIFAFLFLPIPWKHFRKKLGWSSRTHNYTQVEIAWEIGPRWCVTWNFPNLKVCTDEKKSCS